MRDPSANWEQIARAEPYFGVLTDPRFLGGRSLDEFFASGEEDVERLLSLAGVDRPKRVLDFGCGVGRLSRAFAQRAERVVGVDVSPTMIAHAQQLRIPNAEFRTSLPDETFDFIASLIVFQHIPPPDGHVFLEQLLQRLGPNGTAALHFTFTRRGGPLRRLGRRLRASVPLVHRALQTLNRESPRLPYMEMNEYSPTRLQEIIARANCTPPTPHPTDHGGMPGAILITKRIA